jgi:endonuclease/exonuclease/phosphatase family metal-dependent hydrolase
MKTFRVLQFNMQFGQIWDEQRPDFAPIDLDATIAEIRRHDADVILLQEVELAAADGAQIEPAPNYSRLRAALDGYDSFFAYPKADARELPFGIGLAIFCRTPLRDQTRIELPSPQVPFEFRGRTTTPTDRIMIGATTTLHGHDLKLFNAHLLAFFMLADGSGDDARQRRLVADHVTAQACASTILGGDFNVSRHEALVADFAARGFRTVQDREITWRRRPYVLDHIFHNAGLRCVRRSVQPTPVSDHHVLVADFEFGS